jgi:hypothetical protein
MGLSKRPAPEPPSGGRPSGAASPARGEFPQHRRVSDNPDLGPLSEAAKRSDLFAAHGDGFVHHAQFVRTVVARYARLIDAPWMQWISRSASHSANFRSASTARQLDLRVVKVASRIADRSRADAAAAPSAPVAWFIHAVPLPR